MAATYFDEGLPGLMRSRNGSASSLTPGSLRLYTAVSGGIAAGRVKADFTEASGMGYAAATLSGSDWSYATLDTTNHWQIATVTKGWTFTAGAGMTILGWYVTDSGNTKVMFGEAFSSSIVIPAGGGSLSVTVNDKYQGCA